MPAEPSPARDRLEAARRATTAGEYERALDGFVWFHEHALEEHPGLYGVRLSFALMYWLELGAVYPRAIEVLRETRDRAARRLLDGAADFELFHDVSALDERLRDTAHTCRLFGELSASNPAFAAECLEVAMGALVEHGLHELARRHMGDPSEAVRANAERLNEDLLEGGRAFEGSAHEKFSSAARRSYVTDVARIARVVAATGAPREAAALRELAVRAVEDESVRREVERALAAIA